MVKIQIVKVRMINCSSFNVPLSQCCFHNSWSNHVTHFDTTSERACPQHKPSNLRSPIQFENLLQINHPFHSKSVFWSVTDLTMTNDALYRLRQLFTKSHNPPLVICCKEKWWWKLSTKQLFLIIISITNALFWGSLSSIVHKATIQGGSNIFPFNHAHQFRL